ncbi:glycoside hydrolase family 88 protein [Flavobacterium sp.]|uniref:glycoside hydrolase family 88 protein n=1 Tax=Flavobacterium sp. TaxID=239 RepID=UPI0037518735
MTLPTLLLLILIFLLFIIVLIDIFPQLYTWQSRIHIGRITDKEIWKNKIMQKSLAWITAMPTIKLTDNSRLIIIDILKGNYKRTAIQSWQEASLLLGLTAYYKTTKNAKTKTKIDTFVNSKIDANGNWKKQPTEIDEVILAYAIINIPWIDHEKFKQSYDVIYNLIMNLKGIDGTVAYKKHNTNYRFVDTIGFICPFLINYGVKFNNNEAVELSVKQITTYNHLGMLQNTFLPCHTYNINSKLPVGLFGWGRGLGWYAIGLIDSYTALPTNNSNKKILEGSIVQFAKTAIQFQNENGSWSWIVSQNESRQDSSTTATLAWFLENAATIEEISLDCKNAKNKAIKYLMQVTRRDGAIDFSQGDTKAIGIHSQEFNILPFTQGFTLRVSCK